jgi:hypothetical protein
MVRENRIKSYEFPQFSVAGSNFTTYSSYPLNGEVLKVRFQGMASPGSIWIAESGVNVKTYNKNNITSGLSPFDDYVFTYAKDVTTNTTGSPDSVVLPVINNIVYIAGSGMTSGATTLFGPIELFYR